MLTVNDAIEQVLREYHRPMTTRELADEVDARHLYKRKKDPVTASKISSKVHQNPLQ